MIGHSRAITHIVADAAGRFILTASPSERKILIWDALSFICEGKLNDVGVGSMVLATDTLLVSTAKPPFIRLWCVPTDKIIRKGRQLGANFDVASTDIGNLFIMLFCYTTTVIDITYTNCILMLMLYV